MIYIGSDHAGYEMKERIKNYLDKKMISYEDLGTNSAKSCNYPEIAHKVCNSIYDGDFGILICGTGIGMSMVANRHNHIRGALCTKPFQAEMAKKHNNANLLILQGRNMCSLTNKRILKKFLNTEFEGGRHQIRIDMFSVGRVKEISESNNND